MIDFPPMNIEDRARLNARLTKMQATLSQIVELLTMIVGIGKPRPKTQPRLQPRRR